jgi:hypothetical protein
LRAPADSEAAVVPDRPGADKAEAKSVARQVEDEDEDEESGSPSSILFNPLL